MTSIEESNIHEDNDNLHESNAGIAIEPEDEPSAPQAEETVVSDTQKTSSSIAGVKRHKKNEALVQILNRRGEERRLLLQELSKTNEEDPIEAFFKSMALTVKKFSPELQAKAKMDVFRIINELEFQNIRPMYQPVSTSDYVFLERVTPTTQTSNFIDYKSLTLRQTQVSLMIHLQYLIGHKSSIIIKHFYLIIFVLYNSCSR